MDVRVQVLNPQFYANWQLPAHATQLSAGIDLRAALVAPYTLAADERALLPTGLAFEVPEGKTMLLIPRSGMGHRFGIVLGNLTGLIDADYRNEVRVSLWNTGSHPYTVQPGDRICQAVFVDYTKIRLLPVEELSETERGLGGFGHTGTS